MFHLNEAVAAWRARLATHPDVPTGDVDELEDHLREGVADLQRAGLSEEEAFLVIARRLGDTDTLAGEFAAADPGLRRRLRLRWILIGGLVMLVLPVLAGLGAGLSAGALGSLHAPAPLIGWVMGFTRLAIFVIGGVLIWRLLTDDQAARRVRDLGFWRSRPIGAVITIVALCLFLTLLTTGSSVLVSRTFDVHQLARLSLISVVFSRAIMIALPILLLLLLWFLVRPRQTTR